MQPDVFQLSAGGFGCGLPGAEGGGGLVDLFLARPFPQQRQILPGLLDPGQGDVLALPRLIELVFGRQLFRDQIGDPPEFDPSVIEIGLRLGLLRFRHPQFLNASPGLQGRQRRLRRLRLSGGVARRQLVIASVQLGDQLLGFDGIAFLHQQPDDAPANLKRQIHFPRFHGAGQLDSVGVAGALPRPAEGHQRG